MLMSVVWIGLAMGGVQDPVAAALDLQPTHVTLNNGLQVVVHRDTRAPLVATSLRFAVGASEDGPGMLGRAHLVEHLMFRGTPTHPAGEYDRLLAEAGTSSNAWTDPDWTTFTTLGPVGALHRVLALEEDRLRHLGSAITQDDLDNQRQVTLNERLRDELSDAVLPLYALGWLLWPESHPYRWPVLGTRDDLASLTVADMSEHIQRWYTPANAALVVVGDVQVQQVLEWTRGTLGTLPSGSAPIRHSPEQWPAIDPLRGHDEPWVMLEPRADQSLYVAWNTVPRGHPDEPALDLLSRLLTAGRGGRLHDALVYSPRRVSDLQAWTQNGRLGGELGLTFSRKDRRLAPALRALDGQLDQLMRQPPTEQELLRAMGQWRAAMVRQLDSLDGLADAMGECLASFSEPGCLDEELQRYAAVTPEDLQRVAQTYLTAPRVLMAVVSEQDRRRALPRSAEVYAP